MRKIALSLLLFVLSFSVLGQRYSFIQYSLKEGLTQSQVRTLYQDKNGFIWVGTLGGISKFDGRNFESFNRQDGLLNNQISAFLELENGVILAGSSGSVSKIFSSKVESFVFENDLSESAVNAMFSDENGKVWIGTENGICFLENNGKLTYPIDNSEPFSSHIKAFVKCSDGGFLIVTKERIFKWINQGITRFYDPENEEINFFDAEMDDQQTLWLATKGAGLMSLDKEGKVKIHGEDIGLEAATITGITPDNKGNYWLSSRFGFYLFEKGVTTYFDQNNGIRTPDIRDILCDNEGNIWLGTYGSGLLRFTGRTFFGYTKADGLSSDAVMSITTDDTGKIWFSTFDQGVCELRKDTIVHYSLNSASGNDRVWTSLRDKNGVMWFGSPIGLFKYEKNKFKEIIEEDSLPDPIILSLFYDSKDRLLVGTAKGLCYYKNGEIRSFKNIKGYPETRIRNIKEDRAGNIWLATRTGVFKMTNTSFESFGEEQGLPDKTIYCVEVDPQNRVWVGTQNGLALYNGSGFTSMDVDEAGGSNSVNFLKYHNGLLWLGTNNGLYSFEAGERTKEKSMIKRHYGLEDGLLSLETNLNAVYVDEEDKMWFGTAEGVMALDLKRLKERDERTPPKIVITSVLLNFLNPDWRKFKAAVDSASGLPVDLTVGYKNNHFTFQFTGISTTYPADIHYQFLLEGFDEDWQALTKSNFITYSNLPYREFTFKVRAVNRFGVYSEPAIFHFSINPPFWLTWWFILLEVFAVVGLLSVVLYVRRRVLKARFERERLEMRSRMLTLEQQSLNSNMNRHFIFNALNSIQYYINRQDRMAANRYLSDFARLIRKNLDSSQETLTPLREEMERLELYLKLEHMRFKDKFEYAIHISPEVSQDAVKVPAMLLQPFLENAIWHGLLPKETPGRVEVNIWQREGSLHMVVEDDGVGIENSLKSKIDTDSHISKGMSITKSRIDLIKKLTPDRIELIGPQQVYNEDGSVKGTKVEIIIPVNFHELF